MGSKRKEPRLSNVPGPGQYDSSTKSFASNSKNAAASPFLSKSKRAPIATSSASQLGPGAYQPKDDFVKPKNPTYGMSKGQKGISRKDLSPGPGAYDGLAKEIGRDAPKTTIKGRPKTAKLDDLPGPGSYDNNHRTIVNETSKSARGTSAMRNKSARLSPSNRDNIFAPGPGAYAPVDSLVRDRTPNYGFGKTERSHLVTKDEREKPGPGNYELKDQKSAKSFKIGMRLNNAIKSQIPGPGNYDPNLNLVKESVRVAKINKALNQSAMQHSKSTNLIGPGTYY
jgi:hypothetical protein